MKTIKKLANQRLNTSSHNNKEFFNAGMKRNDSLVSNQSGNFRQFFDNISSNLPMHSTKSNQYLYTEPDIQTNDQISNNSTSNAHYYKLPPLSILLNAKNDDMETETHKGIVKLYRYAQHLEEQNAVAQKEIQRLEYLNKYMLIGQKRRDEMLGQVIEENRKLKELVIAYERKLQEKSKLNNETPKFNFQIMKRKNIVEVRSTEELKQKRAQVFKDMVIPSKSSQGTQKKTGAKYEGEERGQNILKMTEMELEDYYSSKESVQFLENLLKIEDRFIQNIQSLDTASLGMLYESIQALRKDEKQNLFLIFRLKKIISAANTMFSSLLLYEALEKIVDETCECLDCDRASVFILDSLKEELWTPVAKGSKNTIRIPLGKGIVSHVATTAETVNIINAYADDRFTREVDIRLNYKTNSVLCVPIQLEDGQIIGVIQAINKTDGAFTKDDEVLLPILASLAGVILKNSINYDEQMLFHNTLRHCLKTGIYLNSFLDLKELIQQAEKKLMEIMSVDQGRVYFIDSKSNQLIHFEGENIKKLPKNIGIVGEVIQTHQLKNIPNAYNYHGFNGQVDIETSLPIICLPVLDSEKIIAVCQVINSKGIQGFFATQKANITKIDLEILDFFTKQLSQSIQNSLRWHQMTGLKPYQEQ